MGLPLLALLPQPLAILEIGASAGLSLIPDRNAYLLGVVRLRVPLLNLTGELLYFVVALALTVRFYLLALSRVREGAANPLLSKRPGC
jgi:hypothetical protein